MYFFNGMKKATEGMKAMRTQLDVLTNNLANVGTAGYQKDALSISSFDSVLQEKMQDSGFAQMGGFEDSAPANQSSLHLRTVTQFQQGTLKLTDNPLDLALNGKGFFVVNTPFGVKYTRNGNFSLNAEGYLSTKDGSIVMGQNGPIKLNGDNFKVKEDGSIYVNDKFIDKLKIVNFENLQTLKKQGANYYIPTAESKMVKSDAVVKQGYLEGSNVNPVRDMVAMITIMRGFETNQKMLQTEDEALRKSIQTGEMR